MSCVLVWLMRIVMGWHSGENAPFYLEATVKDLLGNNQRQWHR